MNGRPDLAASFRTRRRALADGDVMQLPGLSAGQDWITDLACAAGFRLRLADGEEWDAARRVELVKRLPAVPDCDPLVSILIPAYSPRFFEECLLSALAQSYEPLEILIGDDCPDDSIERIVTDLAAGDQRVRYIRHEQTLGGRWNYIRLFELAAGEYIKFLNDDDLLDPECVRIMAACLRERPEVTLVTSYRQAIDAAGNPLPDMPATARPVEEDSLIYGEVLATAVLQREINFIGEPTTTMFRRADAARIRPHILSFAGRPSAGNGDVNLWLSLLSMGDAIYLTRPLSSFRQHEGQRQKCSEAIERGRRGWRQLQEDAAAMGFIKR
jgi:glycosyltransferase involved in cell wall biosynthesis